MLAAAARAFYDRRQTPCCWITDERTRSYGRRELPLSRPAGVQYWRLTGARPQLGGLIQMPRCCRAPSRKLCLPLSLQREPEGRRLLVRPLELYSQHAWATATACD